ncbi:hypothetical protein B9G55_10335 [Saccharibacillus sp. O16]|nr:hypothetical protein B9G55_10335 [Saccharibacillus sp. O16]
MEPTLWEKIILAFQYNDSVWHNIFLSIIYALVGIFALLLLRALIRMITRPGDIRDTDTGPRPSPAKVLMVWLGSVGGMLVFPIGLFLVITIALGSSDSARISSSTLSYEQNGVPASVVIVDKFIANSSGEGITTGTSKAYVYAMNADTGLPLWKKNIGRSYSPMLLGQTDQRIAAFDGKNLIILNKADGSEAADAKQLQSSNPELQGKLPEEAARYRWDAKQKRVVLQGLDGQLYGIDPDTLKGSALSGVKMSDYFGDNDPSTEVRPLGRLGLIRSGADDGRYTLFLTEEEAAKVQAGTLGAEQDSADSAAAADPRKRLYGGSLLKGGKLKADDLKPLLSDVFLNGGFLSDPTLGGSPSSDSSSKPPSDPYAMTEFPEFSKIESEPKMPEIPDSLDWPSRMTVAEYERYSAEEDRRMDAYYAARDQYDQKIEAYRERNTKYDNAARTLERLNSLPGAAPIHFPDPNGSKDEIFLIAHDSVVSNSPSLLLSAVDLKTGKVLWRADTHLQSLESYSRVGDRLLLVGGDSSSYWMTVSLKNGAVTGYDFQYDRSLKF